MERSEIMLEAHKPVEFGKAAGGHKYMLVDLTLTAQRGAVTCLRPHSKCVSLRRDSSSGLCDSKTFISGVVHIWGWGGVEVRNPLVDCSFRRACDHVGMILLQFQGCGG